MIPAGYLLKKTTPPSGWFSDAHVEAVCSLSHCVNDNVVDVQRLWQQNRFGVANTPSGIFNLANEAAINISGSKLFYYEAHELEMETDGSKFNSECWQQIPLTETGGVETAPLLPSSNVTFLGYDVVVFDECGLAHSPLSCNGAARNIPVNIYCLISKLEQAIHAIETGAFNGCKPGFYRIFSVSLVDEYPKATDGF